MTTATASNTWQELGGDGKMHVVHDVARIPAQHLSTEEVRVLQKEVLRLRQKNIQRKQALRDLNAAMERKAHRLTLNNIERNALLDEYEETLQKLRQTKKRPDRCPTN